MTPLDPATLAAIGAGVGAAIGALIRSLMTAKTVEHVKAQIDGPGQEPSLRQMVQMVQDSGIHGRDLLHADMVRLTDRVENIEKAKGETLIATTLSAMNDNFRALTQEAKRTRLNLHKIANVVQIKLYTQEEADALAEGFGADKQ